MNKPFFDRSVCYPSDRYGEYMELRGTIVEVEEPLSDGGHPVKVQTIHGVFSGFTHALSSYFPPQIGHVATIRIYDAGGGWYPDNRITAWGKSSE